MVTAILAWSVEGAATESREEGHGPMHDLDYSSMDDSGRITEAKPAELMDSRSHPETPPTPDEVDDETTPLITSAELPASSADELCESAGDSPSEDPVHPVQSIIESVASSAGPVVVNAAESALARVPSEDLTRAKTAVKNLLGVRLNLDDIDRAVRAAPREQRKQTTPPEREDGLPDITVSDQPLRIITAEAIRALKRANKPPVVFVRAGQLVPTRG
jgi:hypothetical protein